MKITMKITLAFLAFLIFSLPACQQPLEEQDLIYIGSWSSKKFYLEIGANGYGYCQRRNREPVEGRVRITDRRIIFNGDEGGRGSFRIDTPPSFDLSTGDIFMILDNDEFLKH